MSTPHRRSPDEPEGGWLGPCTTGWPDLPELDPPGHMRQGKPIKRRK
jgi:hypothetical protein